VLESTFSPRGSLQIEERPMPVAQFGIWRSKQIEMSWSKRPPWPRLEVV